MRALRVLFSGWHPHHAARLPVAADIGGQHAQQPLGVQPISLGPPCSAVHQDAGRLHDVGRQPCCVSRRCNQKPSRPASKQQTRPTVLPGALELRVRRSLISLIYSRQFRAESAGRKRHETDVARDCGEPLLRASIVPGVGGCVRSSTRGIRPGGHGGRDQSASARPRNIAASGHAAAKASRTRVADSLILAATFSSRSRMVANSARARACVLGMAARTA
jgi:hypothetical protein